MRTHCLLIAAALVALPHTAPAAVGSVATALNDSPLHVDRNDNGIAGGPDTSWMLKAKYGIFMHYQHRILLGYSVATNPQFPKPAQMSASEWNRFVDGFDVKGFAQQMAEAEVGWVMFCIDDHYFAWPCAPNKAFSDYTGYAPGEKCSRRDLILDLADALNAKGVKLICYFAGLNGYMKEPQVSGGLADDGDQRTAPSAESRQRRIEVLKEYADRYKDKIAGWWFDGMELNSYQEPPNDWWTINAVVHAGNPRSIIAFSYGRNEQACIRRGIDNYTGGDTWSKQDLTQLTPDKKPAQGGILWHGKIYCGNVYHGMGTTNQYTDEYLINWISTCNRQGGVVTLDWPFDPQTGLLKEFGFAQLKRVAQALKATRDGGNGAPTAPTYGANLLHGQRNYRFDGPISREVLENCLSRAITMQDLCTGKGDVDDNIRMLKSIGAKFAGRAIYMWGGEQRIADPAFLQRGKEIAERLHRADPELVLQGGVFEYVTEAVNSVPVPPWVFKEFSQEPEKRNFVYKEMLFPNASLQRRGSTPDITRLETKMWFFFLSASYLDIGMEALHFGQLDLVGRRDPERKHWAELLSLVRRYAAKHARRRWVICDAHVPSGGPVLNGKLLLDFHSFPLRPKEVADSPQKAVLEMGFFDSIYGRSKGGITPSGWTCEHLPYLVEVDNWGASKLGGQATQTPRPNYWVWGYDEMSWFAWQRESYRDDWLRYAWNWLKEHDRNGFLEMPGSRVLHDGPPLTPDGNRKIGWYFANTQSPACPQGFNQEETIKAIWLEDSRK